MRSLRPCLWPQVALGGPGAVLVRRRGAPHAADVPGSRTESREPAWAVSRLLLAGRRWPSALSLQARALCGTSAAFPLCSTVRSLSFC